MSESKTEKINRLAKKERKEHPWMTAAEARRTAGDHVREGKTR